MKTVYDERDYAFGQIMVMLRTGIGLTQAGLAELLGISRRAVGEWEAGSSYPKTSHLKHLIEIGVKQEAFPRGQESEKIHELWDAGHQKVLLDEQWLSALLGKTLLPSPPAEPKPFEERKNSSQPIVPKPFEERKNSSQPVKPKPFEERKNSSHQPVTGPRVDWGDALAVSIFYGRASELDLLSQWIVQEHCRIISVLGMGGIGKSALASSTMYRQAEHFDVVIFRSLRNAPSCETFLDDCLQVFSSHSSSDSSANLIQLLLKHFRAQRVLLILDNLEAILEEGDTQGHLRSGFEDYGTLLRRVAETEHQSCLLLTSREKLAELRSLESKHSPTRSLRLSGLNLAACRQLFAEKEVIGTQEEQAHLAELYAGNPLALKIVAETITELFQGEIGQFLSSDMVIFGSIAELLSEQITRLSALEQSVLHWLAIVREPVTLDELLKVLFPPLPRIRLLEAIDGLHRRSLAERGQRQGSFTLQSVVLKHVTEILIEEASSELLQHQFNHLRDHGLVLAHSKEYIRQTQERLLVGPLLAHLQQAYPDPDYVEELLRSQLDQLRQRSEAAQGYGPANLLALLRTLRGHLRGLDLAQLIIRDASFCGVQMQDTSLAGTTLRGTLFTETFDAPWAVAISHTGRYWAAGSRRGEVHVWEAEGRMLHRVWQAHTDTVHTLVIGPDERTLATGSWDGSLKLWDMETGSLLWTGWQASSVNCLSFDPEGRLLASGCNDATIQLWDVTTGNRVQTLTGHEGAIYAMAWNPRIPLLASSGFDGTIRLWQMPGTPEVTCSALLTGHTTWVWSLAWSPDGYTLASGSRDMTVKLWDVTRHELLQTLTGHTDRIYCLVWSPDGQILASTGHDRTIRLWDIERRQSRAVLTGHPATMHTLAFTPDSRCLLSGGDDGTLRVWDADNGQCIRILEGYAVSLYDAAWSPDGQRLASVGTDTSVTIWDVTTPQPPTVLAGHRWVVSGVAWSPDGQLLASSGWDNTIRIWNANTGSCLRLLRDLDEFTTVFQDLAWSPDGHLLATGSYMQGVYVWDMHTYTRRWVASHTKTKIRCVAWHPDNLNLTSGGDDGSICLWEGGNGTLHEALWEHHGGVLCLAWSGDGQWLASGGDNQGGGEIVVWNRVRREVVQTWQKLSTPVRAVTWQSDGEVVISGESDGTIRWWNVRLEECSITQQGHHGAVQALKVSPDGHLLASCGDDGAIQLWDVTSGEWQRTLRQDRPYERMNITGVKGLTEAQKSTLHTLGAIEADSILPD